MADTEDSDEYDAFNLSDFTEEDFAHIDAILQREGGDNVAPQYGGPAITVELEKPTVDIISKAPPSDLATKFKKDASPFQRYRWKKILWVTDLVSPAWCELQFEYGLRQKRSKKINERPASFISSKGKEIFVEKKVAVQNDRVTRRGKSVHKKLEREIRPEEVRIDVVTEEERWALRLVNMLSGLESIMTLGYTREMPVFGILHDQVIVGVIDEISRTLASQASPNSPKRPSEAQATPKAKRIRRTSSPSHLEPIIDHSGGSSSLRMADEGLSTPTARYSTPQTYILHLLDTKTRQSAGLPSHEDTISSRLQLMLYHRLLTNLTSTTHSFDFSSLWMRLNLDAFKPLSTRFILQTGLILDWSRTARPSCLDDLTRAWTHAASQLDVVGVDQTLKIQYRTRLEYVPRQGAAEMSSKSSIEEILEIQEQEAIARAVAESLKDVPAEDEELARALAESLCDVPLSETEGLYLGPRSFPHSTKENNNGRSEKAPEDQTSKPVISDGHFSGSTDNSSSALKDGTPSAGGSYTSKIIGTKEFSVDDSFLDAYLIDVLQWWHGVRPPRGVEATQSRRCQTCEYCEGCEWRESKALMVQTRGV